MCRVAYGLGIFSILFARLSDCVRFDQPLSLFRKQDEKAEISCSHDDNNLDVMLWYQQLHNSKSLALIGYGYGTADPSYESGFQNRFELTRKDTVTGALIISKLNFSDSAVYYCAAKRLTNTSPAHFGNGTKLTVLDPKIKVSEREDINVTVIRPSKKESCKKTVTLVCVARNFYPDHVSIKWMVGGKEETKGVATDPYPTKQDGDVETFTISSRLKVPKKEWENAKKEFKCQVLFYNGTDYLKLEDKVYGIAGSDYTREDYIKSSQVMKLAYGMCIAKSGLYGLVIFVFVWRKGSSGK